MVTRSIACFSMASLSNALPRIHLTGEKSFAIIRLFKERQEHVGTALHHLFIKKPEQGFFVYPFILT